MSEIKLIDTSLLELISDNTHALYTVGDMAGQAFVASDNYMLDACEFMIRLSSFPPTVNRSYIQARVFAFTDDVNIETVPIAFSNRIDLNTLSPSPFFNLDTIAKEGQAIELTGNVSYSERLIMIADFHKVRFPFLDYNRILLESGKKYLIVLKGAGEWYGDSENHKYVEVGLSVIDTKTTTNAYAFDNSTSTWYNLHPSDVIFSISGETIDARLLVVDNSTHLHLSSPAYIQEIVDYNVIASCPSKGQSSLSSIDFSERFCLSYALGILFTYIPCVLTTEFLESNFQSRFSSVKYLSTLN